MRSIRDVGPASSRSGGGPRRPPPLPRRPRRGSGPGRCSARRSRHPDDAHNINDEWVQLVNSIAGPAGLGNWTVSDDAANTYTVPPGYTLGAGRDGQPPERARAEQRRGPILGPVPAMCGTTTTTVPT
jgi:hypothetical protein